MVFVLELQFFSLFFYGFLSCFSSTISVHSSAQNGVCSLCFLKLVSRTVFKNWNETNPLSFSSPCPHTTSKSLNKIILVAFPISHFPNTHCTCILQFALSVCWICRICNSNEQLRYQVFYWISITLNFNLIYLCYTCSSIKLTHCCGVVGSIYI